MIHDYTVLEDEFTGYRMSNAHKKTQTSLYHSPHSSVKYNSGPDLGINKFVQRHYLKEEGK